MKVLVTAGPTREYIDPVRFLSNRSSGKMGYAVAAALCERGHEVVLVSGPVAISPPPLARIVQVVSAEEMRTAVMREFESCDCLVMAAAVADWRPIKPCGRKMKKGSSGLILELEPTSDILLEVAARKGARIVAGFAAETGDPSEEARRKLRYKGLDVIFANDVAQADSGFEVDTNRIVCISADGREESWPLVTKSEAGQMIAGVLEGLYAARGRHEQA
jgi:phosphopantothenoylcysteine decarboxylase/phosphopantothenate--cysteine ligase